LRAPLPLGSWHLVGDGEDITESVDVQFDIVWRTSGGVETVLATTTHTFDPRPSGPNQYDAVLFETDLTGLAAPAAPGDSLVLRFTTIGGSPSAFYVPNGDGSLANGRDPNLTLPPP
jgi:hypothetical protein